MLDTAQTFVRYLFGEIMYGGHIVEDWDRRLANAYLAKFFNESLLEGIQLFPGFFLPPPTMPHPQVGARSSFAVWQAGRPLLETCRQEARHGATEPATRSVNLHMTLKAAQLPSIGAGVYRGQLAC